jgi:hypothetical protein
MKIKLVRLIDFHPIHDSERFFFNVLRVWPVPLGPSVTTSSTDFSFQNLVFWNLFEVSAAEIT